MFTAGFIVYVALVTLVALDVKNNDRNIGWVILPLILPYAGSVGYFVYHYWWIPRKLKAGIK